MKKVIIITALILISGFTFSQTLEKGNLISMRILDLRLQPDVTYNQWKDYIMKVIPAIENAYNGDVELYLIEGIRWDKEDGIGLIYIFKSSEVRNEWLDDEGNIKKSLRKEFSAKFDEFREERDKLIKFQPPVYTDWIVQ